MFTMEELRQAEIFACLEEAQCGQLAEMAADVRLQPGEWLLRDGEPAAFFVVFEGVVRLVVDVHGRPTEFAGYAFKAGDFLGEVTFLLGVPFFASMRAETACRLARLDKQQFHHLIHGSKPARDRILKTVGERLSLIQERTLSLQAARVFIYGRNRERDCYDLRTFLSANRIAYEWVDRDRSPQLSDALT